jgi:hypothetical protein
MSPARFILRIFLGNVVTRLAPQVLHNSRLRQAVACPPASPGRQGSRAAIDFMGETLPRACGLALPMFLDLRDHHDRRLGHELNVVEGLIAHELLGDNPITGDVPGGVSHERRGQRSL